MLDISKFWFSNARWTSYWHRSSYVYEFIILSKCTCFIYSLHCHTIYKTQKDQQIFLNHRQIKKSEYTKDFKNEFDFVIKITNQITIAFDRFVSNARKKKTSGSIRRKHTTTLITQTTQTVRSKKLHILMMKREDN